MPCSQSEPANAGSYLRHCPLPPDSKIGKVPYISCSSIGDQCALFFRFSGVFLLKLIFSTSTHKQELQSNILVDIFENTNYRDPETRSQLYTGTLPETRGATWRTKTRLVHGVRKGRIRPFFASYFFFFLGRASELDYHRGAIIALLLALTVYVLIPPPMCDAAQKGLLTLLQIKCAANSPFGDEPRAELCCSPCALRSR